MKSFKACITFIVILNVFALIMSGCGSSGDGNNDGTTSTTVSGTASKGLIKGGTVKVFALNEDGSKKEPELGTAETDLNGSYSVPIGSFTGNVLVEVTGGTYTDEATGVADTPAPSLKAALTNVSGKVSVAVTPLTDIAVQSAGSALTKVEIEKANYLIGAALGIRDIVSIMPCDVTKDPGMTNPENIWYGLMLAAVSQMSNSGSQTIDQIISDITTDLADGKLDAQGTNILAAYNSFAGSSPYNKTAITAAPAIIGDAIEKAINNQIVIPEDPQDRANLVKAKAMVADLRNTIFTIYDYQGVGVKGVVETPFKNLSEELTTKVGTNLKSTSERIGWIVHSMKEKIADQPESGVTYTIPGNDDLELEIIIQTAENVAGFTSANFTVKDTSQDPAVTVDSGSLTLTANAQHNITSGAFTASMSTLVENEKVTADLHYTGTYSGGVFASITLTGTLTAPGGVSYDFSQEGKKLYATFAHLPQGAEPQSENELFNGYPTKIFFSGRIKTTTAQMDGTLDISNIVWNSSSVNCDELSFVPKSVLFDGTFQELKNSLPTGTMFSGKITGNWLNAATFNMCNDLTANNFPKWNASFDGTIKASQGPTITTHLEASQTAYQAGGFSVSYRRTNANETVVYLSGSGTYNDATKVMTATFSNQSQVNVEISYYGNQESDEKFSGSIKISNATIADLYSVEGVPTIKYIKDGYIESII